jgi:hypothetical protein
MPRHRLDRKVLPALLALWTGWAIATAGFAQPTGAGTDLRQIIRSARIIFVGSIEKPGASNVSLVPASSRTALVRVREVLDAPRTMGDLRGQVVTVLLAKEGSAQAGQEAIFFTNGWMYGENVAVREVAEIPERDREALRSAIAAERQTVRDEELAGRLKSAVLVIAGQVVSARPTAGAERGPRSEHDPEWWQAEIGVASVMKGRATGKTVTVFFPSSLDERWLLVPKLKEGQKAIFLLQPYRGNDLPAGALVILHPLDVQPEQQTDRVRRLLR